MPRPACAFTTPTPTPTASPELTTETSTSDPAGSTAEESLAATGGPVAWLLALGAGLLILGATTLHRSITRRP